MPCITVYRNTERFYFIFYLFMSRSTLEFVVVCVPEGDDLGAGVVGVRGVGPEGAVLVWVSSQVYSVPFYIS